MSFSILFSIVIVREMADKKYKHLDSEYKGRWEEYHFQDGTILDSREINWRDVKNWKNLKELHAVVRGHRYVVTNQHENFKYFVRYRIQRIDKLYNKQDNKSITKKIQIWCIGWCDGEKAHVTHIDFKTAEKLKEEVVDFKKSTHIHPEIVEELNKK